MSQKVAIVTGASSGIGKSTALLFAKNGINVVAVARSLDKLKELSSDGLSAEIFPVKADLSKISDIDMVFNETKKHFGKLDILVNNAGRGIYNLVEEGNPEDWKTVIDLNLFGLIYASKLAVNTMKEHKSGSIVNVSSVGGRIGIPGWAVYNATKWGVNGFSEALRKEVIKYNIRITVIEPGAVETNWGENMPKEWYELRGKTTPLSGDDIANAIFYAVNQPDNVAVNELLVRPTAQER